MIPLALLALTVVVAYAGSCWLFPYARCRWCQGGRKYRSDGKVWRDCRWCRGTGRRLRTGRRVFNAAARRRRDAGRGR